MNVAEWLIYCAVTIPSCIALWRWTKHRRGPRMDPTVARWLLASRRGGPDRMTIRRDGSVSYSYSDEEP